ATNRAAERRLVVVRMDQVDRLAAQGAPEAGHEYDIAGEARRARPGPAARHTAVGDEMDGVPATADTIGELPYQHLRAAQIRIRAGDDERDAHQGWESVTRTSSRAPGSRARRAAPRGRASRRRRRAE